MTPGCSSGPRSLSERTAELDRIGVDIVRFTLRWDQIAVREPRDATDNRDHAYRWRNPGMSFEQQAWRIAAVVTLVGTPSWANGGFDASWAPDSGSAFADFAHAAASRYPFVRYWTIWNKPNQARWLKPATPKIYVTRLLNPAYAAIERVLPGSTSAVASRRRAGMRAASFLSPGSPAWVRRTRSSMPTHTTPTRFSRRRRRPWSGGCKHCQTLSMASLERLNGGRAQVAGPERIRIAVSGYQTNPPDTWLGIEPALQAIYTAEAALRVWKAPYVDMLINFLYQDDIADTNGQSSGWQSGFVTARGTPKPSLRAFMLPLVRAARHGEQTTLWGQVRPRNGVQPYRLQELRFGSWQWLGGARVTQPNGSFRVTVKAGRDTRLRIWSPRDDMFGVTLRVR